MRYIQRLLFAMCATVILSNVSQAQKFSSAEQEVINVQKARMDAAARRDVVAWPDYVADECIFTSDGTVVTKAKMLEHYKTVPSEYDRTINPREYVVHLYGDTAIVNYVATDHEQYGATDIVSEQRRTETLVKRNGSWLLVAIQWDGIPINHRKPVADEGRSYKDYVGQYQNRPGDVEILSIKDGKLWSQSGSEGDWCLPAGGETFFYKEDLGTLTFSRDSQGHVIGYTYRQIDGQEIHSQKVK
jgi:hypothetical protein